jgi:hypothetical protein
MWLAGIDVRNGAVADLAARLDRAGYRGFAQRLGIAFDTSTKRITLFSGERQMILAVLGDAPESLVELREAVRRQLGKPEARLP